MSSVQFDGNFAAFLHQMRFSSNSFHVFCDSRRSPTFFQTKTKIINFYFAPPQQSLLDIWEDVLIVLSTLFFTVR